MRQIVPWRHHGKVARWGRHGIAASKLPFVNNSLRDHCSVLAVDQNTRVSLGVVTAGGSRSDRTFAAAPAAFVTAALAENAHKENQHDDACRNGAGDKDVRTQSKVVKPARTAVVRRRSIWVSVRSIRARSIMVVAWVPWRRRRVIVVAFALLLSGTKDPLLRWVGYTSLRRKLAVVLRFTLPRRGGGRFDIAATAAKDGNGSVVIVPAAFNRLDFNRSSSLANWHGKECKESQTIHHAESLLTVGVGGVLV